MIPLILQVARIRAGQRGLQKTALKGISPEPVTGKPDWRDEEEYKGRSVERYGVVQPGYENMGEPIGPEVLQGAAPAPGQMNLNVGKVQPRYSNPLRIPQNRRDQEIQKQTRGVNSALAEKMPGVRVDPNTVRDQGPLVAGAAAIPGALQWGKKQIDPYMEQIRTGMTGLGLMSAGNLATNLWTGFNTNAMANAMAQRQQGGGREEEDPEQWAWSSTRAKTARDAFMRGYTAG